MMKKGGVIDDADDDNEVRTSASQNHATETMCTEEFFLRRLGVYSSPLMSSEGVGRGEEIDSPMCTYGQSQLSFTFQPDLHAAEQGLQNFNNYFVISW
jgi:hypothetical protein